MLIKLCWCINQLTIDHDEYIRLSHGKMRCKDIGWKMLTYFTKLRKVCTEFYLFLSMSIYYILWRDWVRLRHFFYQKYLLIYLIILLIYFSWEKSKLFSDLNTCLRRNTKSNKNRATHIFSCIEISFSFLFHISSYN